MQFESDISLATFDDLHPGDFFFHPLNGGHSPAIKVLRADNVQAVLDLDLQLTDQSRSPALVAPDDFEGLTVAAVKEAILRPTPGIENLVNGGGGASSIPRGALIIGPSGQAMRVKGPQTGTLYFDVLTGVQVTSIDSARCLWCVSWQIIIRAGDKETVLFQRNA